MRDLSEHKILVNMQNLKSFINKIESLLSSYQLPEITVLQQYLSWKFTDKTFGSSGLKN